VGGGGGGGAGGGRPPWRWELDDGRWEMGTLSRGLCMWGWVGVKSLELCVSRGVGDGMVGWAGEGGSYKGGQAVVAELEVWSTQSMSDLSTARCAGSEGC
jgi:hypothetical protein